MRHLLSLSLILVLAGCINHDLDRGLAGKFGGSKKLGCMLEGEVGYVSAGGITLNPQNLKPECNQEYGYISSVSLVAVDKNQAIDTGLAQAQPISNASFNYNSFSIIPTPNTNSNGKCFALKTQDGTPIKIRSVFNKDQYRFFAPLLTRSIEGHNLMTQALLSIRQANELRDKKHSLQQSLQSNAAFQNGRCVKLQPNLSSLGQKPTVPSYEMARNYGIGACVTSSRAYLNDGIVERALTAKDKTSYLTIAQQYRNLDDSQRLSCARQTLDGGSAGIDDYNSSSNATGVEMALGEFLRIWIGKLSSAEKVEYACNKLTSSRCFNIVDSVIDECVSKAIGMCRYPANNWEARRTQILQEPERLLSSCQQDLNALNGISDQTIANLITEANLNKQEADQIKQEVNSNNERIGLSSAKCE